MTHSPKQTAPGEAGDAPLRPWVGLTTETGGVRWVPAEQADRERAIISLRAALTEAVDHEADAATAFRMLLNVAIQLAPYAPEASEAVVAVVDIAHDALAKFESRLSDRRKVLTDSEVTNAR